jgi:hypothetical protein
MPRNLDLKCRSRIPSRITLHPVFIERKGHCHFVCCYKNLHIYDWLVCYFVFLFVYINLSFYIFFYLRKGKIAQKLRVENCHPTVQTVVKIYKYECYIINTLSFKVFDPVFNNYHAGLQIIHLTLPDLRPLAECGDGWSVGISKINPLQGYEWARQGLRIWLLCFRQRGLNTKRPTIVFFMCLWIYKPAPRYSVS